MSEIDDIFALKAGPQVAPRPSVTVLKKKKRRKKVPSPNIVGKDDQLENNKDPPTPAKKRPIPETIIDPSGQSKDLKRRKADSDPTTTSRPKKIRDTEGVRTEKQFKDSRGLEPRRKTEEGWNIYKEAELGLSSESGHTPLCPFDCECCF